MPIKDNLRRIRNFRKLSQKDLEEKTGIHNRLIQMYESGKRIPKDDNLQKIADALGVDIYALKDLDIDVNNKESIRQLIFQLEEKGLFSIGDLDLKLNYDDHEPHYSIHIPIDEADAVELLNWKAVKEGSDTAKKHFLKNVTVEDWIYDREHCRTHAFMLSELYPDLCTTEYLQARDALTYEYGLKRIRDNAYTFTDLSEFLRDLNRTNDPGPGIHEELYQVFIEGIIPEEFLYEIFEKEGESGLPELARGPIRELYEKALAARKALQKK